MTASYPIHNPSIFEITGADAARYLQGRITQDIKTLEVGQSRRSLVLTPQGKVTGHFVIQRKEDSYLIISDQLNSAQSEEFIASLLQFKVADQVEAKELETCEGLGLPDKSEAELESLRIQAGIPKIGKEIDSKTIAPELPVDDLVSFDKGCYAGQEVVEMAIARGRPNKKLFKFTLENSTKVNEGEEILLADSTAGNVTSACEGFALGFLKKDFLEEESFTISGIKATAIAL